MRACHGTSLPRYNAKAPITFFFDTFLTLFVRHFVAGHGVADTSNRKLVERVRGSCACVDGCFHACVHDCVCVCIHDCICACVRMRACMRACMCACVHACVWSVHYCHSCKCDEIGPNDTWLCWTWLCPLFSATVSATSDYFYDDILRSSSLGTSLDGSERASLQRRRPTAASPSLPWRSPPKFDSLQV